MGRSTFTGGIHPFEGKEFTMDKPTAVLWPKGDMVFPMSQHIGAPARPIVAKGDYVLAGQKIGEIGGFISSNIISSVSGVVKGIEKKLTISGNMVESIIIESDEQYKKIEGFGKKQDYTKLTKTQIRDSVKEAGIVGLGGAGFPTHVKLTPKDDSRIDYVIVNAAECEPYLTSDYHMMLEEPDKIIGGLKVILQLFENAKGIIAIEDNKPLAINKMKELTADEPKIDVQVMRTKYPQGGERQLVYVTTGRTLNSKKLPADVGCIVDNVATVMAVYMAVVKGEPLIHKVITVSGDAVESPQNFQVPIGTGYNEILEAAGGFKAKPEKIVFGGPMMGMAMYTYHVPVMKTSSALLAFLKDEAAVEETACIRCGRCAAKCPMQLVPFELANAGGSQEERFLKLDGLECCGCGCCSYVCPAHRSLTQTIMQTRNEILAKRKKG